MTTRNYDDRIIDRWRLDPKFPSLEMDDPSAADPAPPLWKDLTLASIVAMALWLAAAVLFR